MLIALLLSCSGCMPGGAVHTISTMPGEGFEWTYQPPEGRYQLWMDYELSSTLKDADEELTWKMSGPLRVNMGTRTLLDAKMNFRREGPPTTESGEVRKTWNASEEVVDGVLHAEGTIWLVEMPGLGDMRGWDKPLTFKGKLIQGRDTTVTSITLRITE